MDDPKCNNSRTFVRLAELQRGLKITEHFFGGKGKTKHEVSRRDASKRWLG